MTKAKYILTAQIVLIIGSFIMLISFTNKKLTKATCPAVLVKLENHQENHFLDETDIKRTIQNYGAPIQGTLVKDIPLQPIEKYLEINPYIKRAELFFDIKGNLIVSVLLRRPIARIISPHSPDQYITKDGTLIPTSDKYVARVLLLSGKACVKLFEKKGLNPKHDQEDQFLQFLSYISNHDFWVLQIAQLQIDDFSSIRMYPQITKPVVEFGSIDNYEQKLEKLMIFYKKILPQKNWNRYSRVNLEYDNQIIAE